MKLFAKTDIPIWDAPKKPGKPLKAAGQRLPIYSIILRLPKIIIADFTLLIL